MRSDGCSYSHPIRSIFWKSFIFFLFLYFVRLGSLIACLLIAAGYLTDDESPKRRAHSDLSEFRSVVQDCLDYDPKPVSRNTKPKSSNLSDIDKFSGLRIR